MLKLVFFEITDDLEHSNVLNLSKYCNMLNIVYRLSDICKYYYISI